MQNNRAAEINTEPTNKRVSSILKNVCLCRQSPPPLYIMQRYYATLKSLPSEILISNPEAKLEDVKNCRWLARDTFLQMSQEPFAAANGIGPDHLQNFLNLQDAIISKLLIQKLDNFKLNSFDKLKICGFLQLIFTESPKLIEFLFSTPTKISILKILIENCPSLFNLINLFKDYFTFPIDQDFDIKFYYWNTIVILSRKYPIQATLDLSREVIKHIQSDLERHNNQKNHISLMKALLEDIEDIFPFLKESDIRKVDKRTKLSL
jgi:hypothetical protein